MKTVDGRIVVVAGASRSGKTAWTVKAVKNEKRLWVWDPEDQWAELRGFRRVSNRRDLLDAARAEGPGKYAYVVGGDLKDEFGFWSACVLYAGRRVGPVTAVAEELPDVTNQAKAPVDWGILVRRGLKRGINIYAISTRWAESDKTAFGNASEFVIFRMSSADDVRYMARKTRIPESEMDALKPLDYIRFSVEGGISRGRLKF